MIVLRNTILGIVFGIASGAGFVIILPAALLVGAFLVALFVA